MFSFPCGTPVAGLIVLEPRVEFKPVEADTLLADGHLGEERPDLGVEPIAVHAEVTRRVAEADDAWRDGRCRAFGRLGHCRGFRRRCSRAADPGSGPSAVPLRSTASGPEPGSARARRAFAELGPAWLASSKVTTGARPSLRTTAMSPAPSSQTSARYLALRSRPNRSPEMLLNGTDADRARLAACQSATPAWSDLPGSRAAASSQEAGTGPRKCRRASSRHCRIVDRGTLPGALGLAFKLVMIVPKAGRRAGGAAIVVFSAPPARRRFPVAGIVQFNAWHGRLYACRRLGPRHRAGP